MSQVPRIAACLFDYGNTLVEFDSPQTDWILAELAAYLGRAVGEIDVARLRGAMDHVCSLPFRDGERALRESTPCEQMALLLQGAYGAESRFEPDDEAVVAANAELQRLFVESIAIEPEVASFLEDLAHRVPLGVVSNYPCGEAIRRSLARVGIAGCFRTVVISGDVGFVKPHSRPFADALARLGAPPQEVLFVGDRWDVDMLGASRQGMVTCHQLGYTSDLDLEARYRVYCPDHRVRHVREIESILR